MARLDLLQDFVAPGKENSNVPSGWSQSEDLAINGACGVA
jgi:hypothetical protein